jgi:methylaspartate mutase sigma subunit
MKGALMRRDRSTDVLGESPLHVVVTSVSSDSHTWNLVYLQLVLEEMGHTVENLGACIPDVEMVERCREIRPDLVVVSSLNGHGFHDGMRVIDALRACPELVATPIVIGGKLDVTGGDESNRERLLAAGFDAVFQQDADVDAFRAFVAALPARTPQPAAI